MAAVGPAYRYTATITRVHDGDSLTADVDLGFSIWLRGVALRLAGCNARELAQPGGLEARDNLAALVPPGTAVTLTTVKADKFHRFDAVIILADGTDVISTLIGNYWLAPWDGRGVRPLPPWPRPL